MSSNFWSDAHRSTLLLLCAALVVSCGAKSSDVPVQSNAGKSAHSYSTEQKFECLLDPFAPPLRTTYLYQRDSVILPEFEVALMLSEAAEAKLMLTGESVIVVAFLSGSPSDSNYYEYNDDEDVFLGKQMIELFDERVARFSRLAIGRDQLSIIKSVNAEVLVNVFTGRRTSFYNLIHVEIIQDSIESIKGFRHYLDGRLIYGDKR